MTKLAFLRDPLGFYVENDFGGGTGSRDDGET